jgi:hypothetical protein
VAHRNVATRAILDGAFDGSTGSPRSSRLRGRSVAVWPVDPLPAARARKPRALYPAEKDRERDLAKPSSTTDAASILSGRIPGTRGTRTPSRAERRTRRGRVAGIRRVGIASKEASSPPELPGSKRGFVLVQDSSGSTARRIEIVIDLARKLSSRLHRARARLPRASLRSQGNGRITFSIEWHGPTVGQPSSAPGTRITEGDILSRPRRSGVRPDARAADLPARAASSRSRATRSASVTRRHSVRRRGRRVSRTAPTRMFRCDVNHARTSSSPSTSTRSAATAPRSPERALGGSRRRPRRLADVFVSARMLPGTAPAGRASRRRTSRRSTATDSRAARARTTAASDSASRILRACRPMRATTSTRST